MSKKSKTYVQRAVNKQKMSDIELATLIFEYRNQSDHGTALIGASYLDFRLTEALVAFLVDDKDAVQGFLSYSFAYRTKLAYMVGLVNRDVRDAMDRIRDIRNHFAHEWSGASFEQPPITGWIKEMLQVPNIGPQLLMDQNENILFKSATANRFAYISAVFVLATSFRAIASHLRHRVCVLPFSKRSKNHG